MLLSISVTLSNLLIGYLFFISFHVATRGGQTSYLSEEDIDI